MKMPASLNYNVDKGGNITQTQYRWAFVCVDALTKVAWIYPIEQLPNREAMQGTGIVVGSRKESAYKEDYEDNRVLRLTVIFHDRLSSEIKDEICSKLASALRALKSRISRICGINELERRVSLAPEAV